MVRLIKTNIINPYSLRENTEIMNILLKDRTTNQNIIWATDSYKDMGRGYYPEDEINLETLKFKGKDIIMPRVKKNKEEKINRTRGKGEVFTPSKVIENQIGLVEKKLSKLDLKTYISKKWLEITCGEAPYITSRYDTVTGKYMDLNKRIGFLDRKLQKISSYNYNKDMWFSMAVKAYESSYGYEYQGDSLVIARENLLNNFIDHYIYEFKKMPSKNKIKTIAEIISYNIFQMDGLKFIIPTEKKDLEQENIQLSLFQNIEPKENQLKKSKEDNKYSRLRLWEKNTMIKYIDIIELKEENDAMKFDVVTGNPPFQDDARQQIYTDFYLQSLEISDDIVCLIFPTGWQKPTNANNLKKLNVRSIKRDRQIVNINNINDAFKGVPGAEWTNIIMWKKGYDNGLNGKQYILENGKKKKITLLPIKKEDIEKPYHINKINEIVLKAEDFKTIDSCISPRKPYGLSTNFLKKHKDLNLGDIRMEKKLDSDITIVTKDGLIYVDDDFKFPKKGDAFKFYKVFIPYAWGNWNEKVGLGGAFSDIIIGQPNVACLETYLEAGKFNNEELAYKFAKYLMTKFARALLYVNKYSQHSTTAFKSIPKQTFKESWWDLSIEEINDALFDKYKIPHKTRIYVNENIQKKTEDNIINVKEME